MCRSFFRGFTMGFKDPIWVFPKIYRYPQTSQFPSILARFSITSTIQLLGKLHLALGQNLVALAGKWVFTPLTLIIIGFDTHPFMDTTIDGDVRAPLHRRVPRSSRSSATRRRRCRTGPQRNVTGCCSGGAVRCRSENMGI